MLMRVPRTIMNSRSDAQPCPPIFVVARVQAPTDWGGALFTVGAVVGGLWIAGRLIEELFHPRPAKRDTVRYQLLNGRSKVYEGITSDPTRRYGEHLLEGKRFSSMRIMGVRVSRSTALDRERTALEKHRRRHGTLPKYNRL